MANQGNPGMDRSRRPSGGGDTGMGTGSESTRRREIGQGSRRPSGGSSGRSGVGSESDLGESSER